MLIPLLTIAFLCALVALAVAFVVLGQRRVSRARAGRTANGGREPHKSAAANHLEEKDGEHEE